MQVKIDYCRSIELRGTIEDITPPDGAILFSFFLRQIKKNSKPSLDLNIYFEIFSQRNFAWVGKQKLGELRWDLMLLKWSYDLYMGVLLIGILLKARDRVSRWVRSRGHSMGSLQGVTRYHVMIKTRLVNKHKKGELDKKIYRGCGIKA